MIFPNVSSDPKATWELFAAVAWIALDDPQELVIIFSSALAVVFFCSDVDVILVSVHMDIPLTTGVQVYLLGVRALLFEFRVLVRNGIVVLTGGNITEVNH